MFSIKWLCLLIILVTTLASGAYPFIKKLKSHKGGEFPIGESLAAGVFLGAGLMHMLGDSAQEFYAQHFDYPIAFLLCGATFLVLLLLEHIGRELYENQGERSAGFAILAVIMLSIHSFLAGAALGISQSLSMVLIILLAIMAHKWAASFALSIHINKSQLKMRYGLVLFLIFATMTPLGIAFGSIVNAHLEHTPLLEPIFSALAAGTFLYLGTLHGLKRAVLIERCCNLSQFTYVIIGFVIMAVVAIWT